VEKVASVNYTVSQKQAKLFSL